MDDETGKDPPRNDVNLRIDGMDQLLFVAVLEVFLQQMKIIEGCSKTKIKLNPHPDDSMLQLQRAKMLRDLNLVKDVIEATLIEIREAGVWPSLTQAITDLTIEETESTILQQNHERLKLSLYSLRKELKSRKHQHRKELLNIDNKITLLADKKEDNVLNAKIRLIYADKWLNARAEDQEMRHSVAPAELPSAEHERRVHEELNRAYELQIQEREKAVEYWRVRYADDTSAINITLADRCDQHKKAVAKRQTLQQLYNLHEGEMRAWLTFKRERAARLAREELARKSAATVQAWWRGCMVRRGLGAFKNLRNSKKTPTKSKKK